MTEPFDPDTWLDGFTEAGGSYALTSEGRIWLGEFGRADSEQWRFVCQLAGHPERLEAIKAAVRGRCLIA